MQGFLLSLMPSKQLQDLNMYWEKLRIKNACMERTYQWLQRADVFQLVAAQV